MGWKRVVGKLFLVGAGCGCLAVLMLYVLPWLTQPAVRPSEFVAEERNAPAVDEAPTPDVEDVESGRADGGAEGVAAPTPPVGLRDNGEEVAVVFRVVPGGSPEDEAVALAGESRGETQEVVAADPAESLPPVLSAEDVAAAMEALESAWEEDANAAAQTGEGRESTLEARQANADKGLVGETEVDRRGVPPPPSATRDVQELLEALGYRPGPTDGIWGPRTAGAWRRFARDASALIAATDLPQLPEVAEPSAQVALTPSGGTEEVEDGAGQAGAPQAGLPPQEAALPVVVPDTLRGVMGYRMPLVSRQGVPDQVVSGVLIPAHTSFVVLKPGAWELVGLEPGEVERLRDAARRGSEPGAEPVKRGWNLLRLFRKRTLPETGR